MSPTRLDNLRAQRAMLVRQLLLIETAIAAETGMCAFTALDDRLAESLDQACLANGPCTLAADDLHQLPRTPEPGPSLN